MKLDPPDPNDRRLQIFYLQERDVLEILTDAKYARRIVNLPPDVKIKSIYYEPLHGAFAIILWSMTFEETIPGCAIPGFIAQVQEFQIVEPEEKK